MSRANFPAPPGLQCRGPASVDSGATGQERRDIATRSDIVVLLEDFYAAAFADPHCSAPSSRTWRGRIWPRTLPRLADFWEVARARALAPTRATRRRRTVRCTPSTCAGPRL
ncbi:hypothetical protein ACU686_04925 [Yinghuangia aomiensis]